MSCVHSAMPAAARHIAPTLTDENSTFNDEGEATTGWTATNGTVAVSGDYLRLTKTTGAGSSANIGKSITFTPSNRDYILYGKLRSSMHHDGDTAVVWILNGSKEMSFWLGTTDGGFSGPGLATGAASITGTTGAATYNRAQIAAAGALDYENTPVEFALQFDSKFAQLNCWFREGDGRWKLKGRVDCDWFDSPTISIYKGSQSNANTWVEFDYLTLCQPNLVAIGDSICEGKALFSPDLSLGLDDDESSWQRHAVPYPALRNNLIVNKGVGSQTSTQILARIADATGEAPKVVYIHASTNDEVGAISQATRTSNIQSTIDAVIAAGAFPVLLNAVYGQQGGADNLPTPDLRDYMTTWWETYRPTLAGVFQQVDIMRPIIDANGFTDAAYSAGDGTHLTATGYALVADYLVDIS